jgi:bifunctional NMN adenylyltransferase/nudix hydrolase
MLQSNVLPQGVEKEKPYDLAVVIGRFQLPHAGHALLFNKALELANHVLIVKGSSFQPRTVKNPFTFQELSTAIKEYFSLRGAQNRVHVQPCTDNPYSDTSWLNQVQSLIEEAAGKSISNGRWTDRPLGKPKVCVIGHKKEKDDSTYYLDLFPQYDFINVSEFKLSLDSTTLRTLMYEGPDNLDIGKHLILPTMIPFLEKFVKTQEYRNLIYEHKYYKEYPLIWGEGPFLTADAVVVKAGHILLVQRGDNPGKGLWAIPGGFVNKGERIYPAAIRELYEETKIDVPPAVVKGSLKKSGLFDDPKRSLRGRVITHAYLFDLDGHDKKPGLPKVKGSDDAKEAKWFPISQVLKMGELMFEDHLSIITNLLGIE